MKAALSSNPYLFHGKINISNTRVTVDEVATAFQYAMDGNHWVLDKLADRFGITLAQLFLALSYYYDNPDKGKSNEGHG